MSQNLELYRDLHNESLWTPEVVYDVTPQNALVRGGYNYVEGADGYNKEKTEGSLLDGAADFFTQVFSGMGQVIGGVVKAGVGVLSHIVSGVTNLIGGIASAIRAIFGGGPDTPPPEPIFNPIKTNLEAALAPHLEKVDNLLEDSAGIGDDIKAIQQKMHDIIDPENPDSTLQEMRGQINTQGSTLQELRGQINTQGSTLQEMRGQINTQDSTLQEMHGIINLENPDSKLWQLQDKVNTQNSDLWKLQGKVNTQNDDLWKLQNQINTQNDDLWELQDKVNTQNDDLWELQNQINTLNTQRDDLQDQMMELNRKSLDSLTEYVSRAIFIPRDTPVIDEYFTISRTSDKNRWRVTAKPGWVGYYVWQSAYFFDTDDAAPIIDGREVGIQREWDEYAWNRNQSILTYWVRKGTLQTDDKSVGWYVSDQNAWTIRPELTFTAAKTADHDLYYRVTWNATTFEDEYGVRIVKNGSNVLFNLSATKVGPLFPWESGVRNQTISEFKVPLNEGDVITFESYSNASQTSQREVSFAERKIGWVYDPKE